MTKNSVWILRQIEHPEALPKKRKHPEEKPPSSLGGEDKTQREKKKKRKMALVRRASPELPNLLGLANRSFKSLRFPGKSLLHSSTTPPSSLSHGIHVFHCPVNLLSLCLSFSLSFSLFVSVIFSLTKQDIDIFFSLLFRNNRMRSGLWRSSQNASPLEEETSSAPMCLSPRKSMSFIQEGTFLSFLAKLYTLAMF